MCANASGPHKLTPLTINKSRSTRCFKNTNTWMTANIFKDWFFKNFVLEVKSFLRNINLQQKAVLLLYNAPSHPSVEKFKTSNGKTFVMFFPPNVTPLL